MKIGVIGTDVSNLACQMIPNPIYSHLCKTFANTLETRKATKLLSGFYLGFDLWAVNLALKRNIEIDGIIPYPWFNESFDETTKKISDKLLSKSNKILLSENYSEKHRLTTSKYIIDNCDLIVTIDHPAIITNDVRDYISYSKVVGKECIVINPFCFENKN